MNLAKTIIYFLILGFFSSCAPEIGGNESGFNMSNIPQELQQERENRPTIVTNTRASITINSMQFRNTCTGYNPDGSDLVYTFTLTTFTSLNFITLATCTLTLLTATDSSGNVYTPSSTAATLQLGTSNTFSPSVQEYQSGSQPVTNFAMSWNVSALMVYVDYIANEDVMTTGTIYAVDQKNLNTAPPTISRIDMNDTNFNMRLSLARRRGAVYSSPSVISTGCTSQTANLSYTTCSSSTQQNDYRYEYFSDTTTFPQANTNPPVAPTIAYNSNKSLNNVTETFSLPLTSVGKCFILLLASGCTTHSYSCPESNGCSYSVLTSTRYQ